MNKNKGFTLIELLVVIAIIGILSSVVLASLSSARNKGKDAAVKSQLASMRAQAEIFFSQGDTYLTLCTTDATSNGLGGLLAATIESEGILTTPNYTNTVGTATTVTCHSGADAWAVEAPLVADTTPNAMYCVDSAGASKVVTSQLLADTFVCPI